VRRAVAVFVAGLLLCGCAIGAESSAHVVDPKLVPRGLLSPASTSPAPSVQATKDNITIFLELGAHLLAANRMVRPPVTLAHVLRVLERGPTTSEETGGIQSPLSAVGPIILRSLVNGTASVGLPIDFTDLGGEDQILAAAQLVYTVTAFPGVDRVAVFVNGQAAAVPTANGSLSQGPLLRSDYSILAPR